MDGGQLLAKQKDREREEDELDEKKNISVHDVVKANILEEQIKQRHIIEFGKRSPSLHSSPFPQTFMQEQVATEAPSRREGKESLNLSTLEALPKDKETNNLSSPVGGQGAVPFSIRPQPAFNRQFNLLIQK